MEEGEDGECTTGIQLVLSDRVKEANERKAIIGTARSNGSSDFCRLGSLDWASVELDSDLVVPPMIVPLGLLLWRQDSFVGGHPVKSLF